MRCDGNKFSPGWKFCGFQSIATIHSGLALGPNANTKDSEGSVKQRASRNNLETLSHDRRTSKDVLINVVKCCGLGNKRQLTKFFSVGHDEHSRREGRGTRTGRKLATGLLVLLEAKAAKANLLAWLEPHNPAPR